MPLIIHFSIYPCIYFIFCLNAYDLTYLLKYDESKKSRVCNSFEYFNGLR